jgi:chromosomal replication initiator protein
MNADQVWQAALGELQLELPRAAFETWLREARLVAYEDGTFVVGVANAYAKDWVENRLHAVILRILAHLAGRTVAVRFVVWEKPSAPEITPLLQPPEEPVRVNGKGASLFNTRYTFDSFVVGPGNRLAHAACQAVAEKPASTFNPLFLYGGVGLGKTHLLHAVGHICKAQGLLARYVPAETFTNDLIEAIRTNTTEAFRGKYRTVDVFLVDDIQFIAGKESTQEEFFHTFNTLHGNGAQVVISSDRPPRAMATLEERLRSRFEWGLMVDIQPPELETRIAILRRKSEGWKTAVPDEILYLIAERIQSNIRELEGALNRILATTNLTAGPLTVEMARVALIDMMAPARQVVTADAILHAVIAFYRLTEKDLTGPSRSRQIARPRQIAMYLMRQETDASLSQVGEVLGGRDHTTVIHACERITDLMDEDEGFRREVQSIRERLYRKVPLRQAVH